MFYFLESLRRVVCLFFQIKGEGECLLFAFMPMEKDVAKCKNELENQKSLYLRTKC